jgi:RNA polymerase sigma factor (sigma-70 family)
MKKDRKLLPADFERFLAWISPDPAQAGDRYNSLHRSLIVIFKAKGCHRAEELADETLDRAICRLPEIIDTYQGAPIAYIRAIANNLFLEYLREQELLTPFPDDDPPPVPVPPADEDGEQALECLRRCLTRLPSEGRQLVLDYYQEEGQSRIEKRRQLAEQIGIALNALRLRAHRLRATLESCLEQCLEQA